MRFIPAQQIVANAVEKMPVRSLDEFYDQSHLDGVIDHAFEAADKLVKLRDPLTHAKMRGLAALDDYNAISSEHGQAMFLIGVEYARRHFRS